MRTIRPRRCAAPRGGRHHHDRGGPHHGARHRRADHHARRPARSRAIDTTRRYAVGTSEATFVDSSRSTSANGDFAGAATRTIPVEFFYPAEGGSRKRRHPSRTPPPTRRTGPYPLILFSHGYAVTPEFYRPLLERWAAAGYVVAAPVYPILSGTPGGASHTDYEKTFDDARFVISQVLALPASDPLSGLVDPKRIAAAGHSDGEVVAFAQGLLQCCRDERVKAVLAMAGDLSNANNPHVRNAGVPILHVMETEDEYDPYQHSIDWDRENLDAPRWMLSLLGVEPRAAVHAAGQRGVRARERGHDRLLRRHPQGAPRATRRDGAGRRRQRRRRDAGAVVERADARAAAELGEQVVAHLAAQHLAGGGLRQLVGELDDLGRLQRAEAGLHPLLHVLDVDLLDARVAA